MRDVERLIEVFNHEGEVKMEARQKVKALIIAKYCEWNEKELPDFTGCNIDALYDELDEEGDLCDMSNEIRGGEVETNIPSEYSRHYESKSVAAKALDGSWVGWTYWYGGGKHGEPQAVDWIDYAYDLECAEEEKVVTVRTFKQVEPVTN